ncbi:MAG TPA: MG2 domain-containing protein, partial [Anaeromyxobacteraceae bacterium]|nr:MG2 domain-containing protein [Anaeromyxobacteraceae bacterium]
MIRTHRAIAAALAVVAAVSCSPRPPSASREAEPLALEPLPETPQVAIVPDALPGSDGSLAVVAAGPRGRAHGIVVPTITFSKPVVPLEAATAVRPAPAVLAPPAVGEWRWLGSSSVEFAPAAPLPEGTRFTVTVPAGLKALDGSVLAEPFSWTFETPPPAILSADPRDGWAWVRPGDAFSVNFDRPVADLGRHVSLRAGGEAVPLRVTGPFRVADEERALRKAEGWDVDDEPDPRDRRVRYALAPERPLPAATALELAVDGELHGEEGPLPVGQGRTWRYRTQGGMALEGAKGCSGVDRCPYGPILVRTSNLADPRTVKGRVRVEPPVEIDWDRVQVNEPTGWESDWHPHFSLPGRFRPGVTYTVTVAPGIRDALGQEAGGGRFTVRMDDLEPALDMARGVALLEASGDGALPAQVENLTRLEVMVWRLTPPEVARLLAAQAGKPGAKLPLPANARSQDVDLGTERNVTRTRPIPVRALLDGARTALFYARVRAPELDPQRSPPVTVLGQITDLAVHAKLGTTSGVVWVTRISDGKPAGGATVTVHGPKGDVIFTGKADAQGVCDVPGLGGRDEWSTRAPGKGWLVAATLGGDTGITLSTWSGPFHPWFFGVDGDWDGTEPRSLGTVFTDRGIYRPGQEVHVKGVARYRRLGAIETPPAGTRVRVALVTPRGAEVQARDVTTTAYGTFSTRFEVEKGAPLGTWSVVAAGQAGGGPIRYGGTFRVEEYRAPQFRVDVSTPERSLVAGDALQGTVLARYLFGGAMADAAVAWTTSGSMLDWRPPGNEGFLFGNQVGFWDDREPARARFVAASGKGKTDAKGLLAIDAGRAEAPGDGTWEVVLEAEVADVNRQRVAGRATAVVHPASVYAGLRRQGAGFAEAGKPLVLEVVTVTPAGVRQAADVEVSLRRREWRSIKKKVVGERWMTVTEPVEEAVGSCRVRPGAEPAPCTFQPKAPGLHVAEAVVRDERGRRQATRAAFYVVGDGWVSWNRDDTDRIEMVADKEVYAVGDTARVLV